MFVTHAIINSVGLVVMLMATAGLITVVLLAARSTASSHRPRMGGPEAVPVWWDQVSEAGELAQDRSPSAL